MLSGFAYVGPEWYYSAAEAPKDIELSTGGVCPYSEITPAGAPLMWKNRRGCSGLYRMLVHQALGQPPSKIS